MGRRRHPRPPLRGFPALSHELERPPRVAEEVPRSPRYRMQVLAPSPAVDGPRKTPQFKDKDDGFLRPSVVATKTLAADMRPHAPRGSRRRARTTVAAAPTTVGSAAASLLTSAASLLTSAAVNHLSGFYVRAVEPRESSYLHYTSLASPGTHTEYHISVSDVIAGSSGGASSWVVSRRFSAFLLLRDELLRGLSLAGVSPHCALCGALREELMALADELPRKRLWGSSRASVVRRRAAKFLVFLRALLGLATNAARLRCPVVCFGFAVQVRTFLTRDSEPTGKPSEERVGDGGSVFYYHHPLMGATAVYAMSSRGGSEHAGRSARGGRSLLEVAIREGDEEEEEEEEEEEAKQEERPVVTRRGSYSLASTSTSRRSSMEDASSHTSASTASSSSNATISRTGE